MSGRFGDDIKLRVAIAEMDAQGEELAALAAAVNPDAVVSYDPRTNTVLIVRPGEINLDNVTFSVGVYDEKEAAKRPQISIKPTSGSLGEGKKR